MNVTLSLKIILIKSNLLPIPTLFTFINGLINVNLLKMLIIAA